MTDKQIIQELAKRYMEHACSEAQEKANQRMKDTNDLKIVRPPVLIDEIPWHELESDSDLVCLCEDARARSLETVLRRALYQKKHFRCDLLMQSYWAVRMAWSVTPIGVEGNVERHTEQNSRSFRDVLEDEDSLALFREPEFALHPEQDADNMEYYTQLLGDAMPVKLVGHDYLYNPPWDNISFLRGVEPIYEDMYERPEYLHRIMQKFTDRTTAQLDFIEKHSHVSNDPVNLHCTPGMISGLAEDGWKATWYRGMAQPFSVVSPAMFKEFELDYIKPLAERFAYTYYGCCEPLDDRIELLKSIRNLRKVGVSPWASVDYCAEQLGKAYVFARKPNPAYVALRTDPEVIRKETEAAVKACIKNGCPSEYVIKDISTVSAKPENLVVWADTVNAVMDAYYGRE